ncbi:MAG: glycosyltransferase family 2 protein [Chloroflexota bacterium]
MVERPSLDGAPAVSGEGLSCSVIIPARNAEREIGTCLAALAAETQIPAIEIIVVDDGSDDSTAETALKAGARVIRVDRRGPAAARNAGAREARGELLLVFDSDCVPQPGCVAALIAPFEDPCVAATRGVYDSAQRQVVARMVQLEMEEKQARLAASRRTALVDTVCAAYRRELFLRYGGFDESFRLPSAEDAELSFRLASRGEKLVYAPGARVLHRHAETWLGYCLRKFRFGFYRARVYRRYPSALLGDGYTPRAMPLQIGLAGIMAMAAAAAPWSRFARRAAAGSGSLLGLSALPLALRAWRSDRWITPLVLPAVFCRALSQGLGLTAGLGALAISGARQRWGTGKRGEGGRAGRVTRPAVE